MPRTGYSSCADLVVETVQNSYKPGDTILGIIEYKPSSAFSDDSLTNISLKFWGRTKTKMIRRTGQNRVTYRGRALLFEENVNLTEIYVANPNLDVKRAWQFVVQVPISLKTPCGGDQWPAETPFLSSQDDASECSLPSVFYYNGISGFSGSRKEAYVEYVLTATACLLKPGKSSPVERTVTIPLMIRDTRTEEFIQNFNSANRTKLINVRSLKLLPDKQDMSLSLRERMRSTFQSSKLPRFGFDFGVTFPGVVQLENPSLPFTVSVKPRTDNSQTMISSSDYPNVRISSLTLSIESTTHIRTQGTLFGCRYTDKVDGYTIYKSADSGKHKIDVVLQPDPTKTVNLGQYLGLSVHSDNAYVYSSGPDVEIDTRPPPPPTDTRENENPTATTSTNPYPSPPPEPSLPSYDSLATKKFRRPLCPTFRTYNIAHTHMLNWKFKLEVLGTDETYTVEDSAPVQVIGEPEAAIATRERDFDGRGTVKIRDDLADWTVAGIHAAARITGLAAALS